MTHKMTDWEVLLLIIISFFNTVCTTLNNKFLLKKIQRTVCVHDGVKAFLNLKELLLSYKPFIK